MKYWQSDPIKDLLLCGVLIEDLSESELIGILHIVDDTLFQVLGDDELDLIHILVN